jgi:hypothetical protein
MLTRLLTGTLLLGFGLLLSGCSRSGLGREGEVSGKVTYKGKPLPGGQVTFMTPQGYGFNGVIDPEGNYKVRPLVGEVRIAVDNSMLARPHESAQDMRRRMGMEPAPGVKVEGQKSAAPAITGTYVPLPDKYRSPDTSGLTYTVKSGSQTHDIELSDNP